jgi:hypothetical protein
MELTRDTLKVIVGLPPRIPTASVPDYVSLKGYQRLIVIVTVDNATTVTGSAITLKQAKAVDGSGEKSLAFTTMGANVDTDASETLTESPVTGDTFTTGTVNDKNACYVLEVKATDLDYKNGFDCVRVGTGNATAAVLSVLYLLVGGRYSGAGQLAATTD